MSGVNKATRVEIIQWLKDTLLVSINKFEEVYNGDYSEVVLCLGAFSCQIIDILFPCKDIASASSIASMPMSKVNFLAKEPFEIQKNYRLIQSVLPTTQLLLRARKQFRLAHCMRYMPV